MIKCRSEGVIWKGEWVCGSCLLPWGCRRSVSCIWCRRLWRSALESSVLPSAAEQPPSHKVMQEDRMLSKNGSNTNEIFWFKKCKWGIKEAFRLLEIDQHLIRFEVPVNFRRPACKTTKIKVCLSTVCCASLKLFFRGFRVYGWGNKTVGSA